MREEFLRLRSLLDDGASLPAADTFTVPIHRRLARALATGDTESAPGKADLVALVAHVLRREEARSRGQAVWLRVPAARVSWGAVRAWPDVHSWRAANLGVREEEGRYKLTPRHWIPAWLPSNGATELLDPLMLEEQRRTYTEVAGDPFLRAIGRSRYRCDAQREAIRAILSVPDGATVVVNLPTGAGKSLCAQLPSLLRSDRGGVSVVVVPTTALALDQERAVRQWVPHDTAYIGGTSAAEQERRRAIRARVRDGSQRILFTSPEGLLQSLRPALYDATRRGLVRYLVVDEAHMVEQWGDEFRSAFQEVSGLRKDLRSCVPVDARPFTTVLLTATLTESALDTLETLFGDPGPLALVSAAQLRPEPSYWAVKADDAEQQADIVLEAIHHLPRPLLLYLTQPADANAWRHRLRDAGYHRVDVVTGATPNDERGAVIRRWRDAATDIVVATSAFGLGVDQSEVRAVVHATLPENVDRFYQEVGRGGRDGAACASLVVYTPEDVRRAESMNRKTIIGIERGRERWMQMFERREELEHGRVRVPIDVQPSLRPGDIDMDNDLNRAWNVRTLTLMSRAHLLDLDAEPPPAPNAGSAEPETASCTTHGGAQTEHQRYRVVSLRHHGTTTTQVWEREVEPVRRRAHEADRRSHELMLELLRGTRCVSEILAEAYTIPARTGEQPRPGVTVGHACGGCARCRAEGRTAWADPLPTSFPRWPVVPRTDDVLRGLRGVQRGIAVFYRELAPHRIPRLLQWAVGQGVRVVIMPSASLVELGERLYQTTAAERLIFTYPIEGFHFLAAPELSSLLYLPPGVPLPLHLRGAFEGESSDATTRLLVAPWDLPDPYKPHTPLRAMLNCATYGFEDLSLRIGL